ncbi:MAG: hypothetical protein WBV94_02865 [Blastocatellia bacterium]
MIPTLTKTRQLLELAVDKISMVIAKVLEWQGAASQHDDITLIIMKVK